MKRLLLSLSLAGAAVYAVNPLITTQDAVAVQTHPTHSGVRHLRSWGSYLSSLPLSQKPQTPMATYQKPAPLPPQQNAAYGPRPNKGALVKIRSERLAQTTGLQRQLPELTARNPSRLSGLR